MGTTPPRNAKPEKHFRPKRNIHGARPLQPSAARKTRLVAKCRIAAAAAKQPGIELSINPVVSPETPPLYRAGEELSEIMKPHQIDSGIETPAKPAAHEDDI